MRIDIESLCFSYGGKPVLKGVDLSADTGEMLCIVGPNGSGKSTLIKCVESLLMPGSGRILLDGRDSKTMHRMEIARLLGYVPQTSNHSFSSTVFDTILMGRRPYASWHTGEADVEKVAGIVARMDLNEIALRDFNCLSGGQQQRVLIARALAQEPKALLLDEPTSSLDIAFQLEVMDTIKDLSEEKGLSVVMIVHDLNLASRYADRVALLNDGRIYAVGSPAEVFTKENLAFVYGISASVEVRGGKTAVYPIRRLNCFGRKGKSEQTVKEGRLAAGSVDTRI